MAGGDILGAIASQTTLEDVQSKAAEILETLGNSSGGGTEDTVIEMLQELLTQPKVVKHIQRGTFTIGSGGGTSTIQLENFSNENKMICLVDGYGRAGDTDSDWAVTPYITSLSLTELKIKALASGRTSGLNGFYQVIEFC